MSMFSIMLEPLIDEFPEDVDTVRRLLDFLGSQGRKPLNKSLEFTITRLFDCAKPSSLRILTLVLSRLVDMGVLRKFVRVESDSYGGIGDFGSILDVPSRIFDSRKGISIDVRMDQIKLIYAISDNIGINGTTLEYQRIA